MEFTIPPYEVVDVVESLNDAKAEHVGWQIRSWQAQKIHDEFGITGKGVFVGVGDTGVSRAHLTGDLAGVADQRSFVGDNNPFDRNGHGSHCLGIIGAKRNDNGMIGYAPDSTLFSSKVLSDRGSGGDRGIADGIDWMVDQGCKIISLSLGSPSPSQTILGAIKRAHDAKVIVFAAAGNDGRSNDIDEPANSGQCVPVGALDSGLRLANFSDKGRALKDKGIVAGGVNVYSTVSRGYASYSGTSMATPGAAGQCALLIEAEIKFTGQQQTKSYKDFLEVVDDYHVDLGPTGADASFGRGAFDVYKCVQELHDKAKPAPNPGEPTPDEWSTIHTSKPNQTTRLQVKK